MESIAAAISCVVGLSKPLKMDAFIDSGLFHPLPLASAYEANPTSRNRSVNGSEETRGEVKKFFLINLSFIDFP